MARPGEMVEAGRLPVLGGGVGEGGDFVVVAGGGGGGGAGLDGRPGSLGGGELGGEELGGRHWGGRAMWAFIAAVLFEIATL